MKPKVEMMPLGTYTKATIKKAQQRLSSLRLLRKKYLSQKVLVFSFLKSPPALFLPALDELYSSLCNFVPQKSTAHPEGPGVN